MKHVRYDIDEDGLAEEENEPVLQELLRDALAPYLDVMTPEQIKDHRAFLIIFITTHPYASRRYERLRRRAVMAGGSGKVVKESVEPEGAGDALGPTDAAHGKKLA